MNTPYEELLNEYGSPLYVYDQATLLATIQRITDAVPYERKQFHFASVTNGNLALLQVFRQHGWGLHANTPGDVVLGLRAGFRPEQIVYSGSNLNQEEMQQMLDWRVGTLNLDSLSQLESLCEVYKSDYTPRLGFRLHLPDITGDNRIGYFTGRIAASRSNCRARWPQSIRHPFLSRYRNECDNRVH